MKFVLLEMVKLHLDHKELKQMGVKLGSYQMDQYVDLQVVRLIINFILSF